MFFWAGWEEKGRKAQREKERCFAGTSVFFFVSFLLLFFSLWLYVFFSSFFFVRQRQLRYTTSTFFWFVRERKKDRWGRSNPLNCFPFSSTASHDVVFLSLFYFYSYSSFPPLFWFAFLSLFNCLSKTMSRVEAESKGALGSVSVVSFF